MGIENKVDDLFITTHRKLPKVTAENVNVMTGDVNMDSDQVGYIEYRLGSGFTEEDYDRFKIVWNSSNLIPFISSDRIRHTLPSNDSSISFLSDTRATMLTRFFNSSGGMRWKNINLYPSGGKAFYTIKSSIDLFYTGNTVVNVAEGIFDLLSVYKNFNSGENSIYLAILGKDYTDAIDYLVARGIVGSSVVIRMYIDSDINVSEIKKLMRYYKWLFGSIIIVRNSKADDFGVKIENIDPIETRV
jgi:hypothetical protein